MQLIGLAAWGYAAACALWGVRTGRISVRAVRAAAAALLAGSMSVTVALVMRGGMDRIQTLLPLHLCSACAILSLIFYVRPAQWMFAFLFYVGMPGAALALCFPAVAVSRWQDAMDACFFLTHALVIFAPALHIASGTLPEEKHAWGAYAALLLFAGIVYAFNAALGTNYLFLMGAPAGTPLVWLWRQGRIADYAALGALSLAVVTAQRAVARLLRKRSFRADERKARHSDV